MNNDRLISLNDAIDAIEFGITYARAINKETGEVKELFQEGNNELKKAVERVKALPSAQSEEPSYEVIKEYCRKRCLSIVDTALLEKYAYLTVNATEVIRCKDCKYWDIFPTSTVTPSYHECKVLKLMTTGTWYCASSERKDSE